MRSSIVCVDRAEMRSSAFVRTVDVQVLNAVAIQPGIDQMTVGMWIQIGHFGVVEIDW